MPLHTTSLSLISPVFLPQVSWQPKPVSTIHNSTYILILGATFILHNVEDQVCYSVSAHWDNFLLLLFFKYTMEWGWSRATVCGLGGNLRSLNLAFPHYDSVYLIGQGLNMGIVLPTKYVYSSCIFRDLENDYQVSMWTLLTYCEQNLG